MRMKTVPGNAPKHRRGLGCRLCAVAFAALAAVATVVPAQAAFTEPRLALTRATPFRSDAGRISLELEGTFSFADAVQLGVPVSIRVTQGQSAVRFELDGGVFTSSGGGPEQPLAGPGIVAFTARSITVVLPAGFASGAATAQMTATYEGKPVASNRLGFSL